MYYIMYCNKMYFKVDILNVKRNVWLFAQSQNLVDNTVPTAYIYEWKLLLTAGFCSTDSPL